MKYILAPVFAFLLAGGYFQLSAQSINIEPDQVQDFYDLQYLKEIVGEARGLSGFGEAKYISAIQDGQRLAIKGSKYTINGSDRIKCTGECSGFQMILSGP
jgi:hypothetical protein